MRFFQRAALLLALLAATGCGTWRSVLTPATAEDLPLMRITSRPLRHGELLDLELADGSRLLGLVAAFGTDSLLLDPAPEFITSRSPRGRPFAKRCSVAYADIQHAVRIGDPPTPDLLTYVLASLAVFTLALLAVH